LRPTGIGSPARLPLPEGAKGMPGIIVPRKTVGEVLRLIEDGGGEVLVELSQGKIRSRWRAWY